MLPYVYICWRMLTRADAVATRILNDYMTHADALATQILNNYMAVAVADCGSVRSSHCLFHQHNKGGIFGMLSAGDVHRDSVLDVKDNKVARTQDKNYTALGRPGQVIQLLYYWISHTACELLRKDVLDTTFPR